jgi:hypothetical protein
MAKLTEVEVRKCISAESATAKEDGDGLASTLTAKGMAAWVLRYRFGGKAQELTLQ